MSGDMISYNEALSIIKNNIKLLRKEIVKIDLLDSLNHILAEDVICDINQPAFDNSAVDGYAIKFEKSITEWEIVGEISAGNFSDFELTLDTTVSIMTGGKIPSGCNAVIPIEDVSTNGNSLKLNLNTKIFRGMNIRKLGENLKIGQLAVSKNRLISAANISALADCGKSEVEVYKPIKAAVFSTGDELIPINELPTDDKIRATNIYSVLALLKSFNLDGVNLGFSNDSKEIIKSKIQSALESGIDILLTTGGVSVGKYDFLKEVFEELDVKRKFWRTYIKPGKPLYFGVFEKDGKHKLIFGLAGNPVSSFVNIYAFLIPALEEYYSINFNKRFFAKANSIFKKKDSKRHFVRGVYELNEIDKTYTVSRAGSQSSGNMAGLSDANCLVVLDEQKQIYEKGELVECIKM